MKTISTILILTTAGVYAQREGAPPHSRMLIRPVLLQSPAKPSPLESPKVQDKLLSLFKSSTKTSRKVGYKAVHDKFKSGELKADDRRLYRVLIGKAEEYHLKELESYVEDVTTESSPRDEGTGIYKAFNKLYGLWYISALNSREMSQTDWRRVQQFGSFQGMEKEIKDCAELFSKLAVSWEKIKDDRDYRALYETCEAVNECREEIAWCDGEEDFKETSLNRMVTAVPAGVSLKQTLERIDSFDTMAKEYASAAAFNEKQTWASEEVRGMVKILNGRRLKMGLVCFKLDELLSRVCTEHSQDMVKRKFFSHTGSDGKDYEVRVKDADWYGGPFGEVIYSGSVAPSDVHSDWWKSEDNRPKLYTPHLNRIGIGIINKTWTVIVGSSYESRSDWYIVE